MGYAIRNSIGSWPASILATLILWKLFKGRNWARILYNVGIPCSIILTGIRAVSQYAVNLTEARNPTNLMIESFHWGSFFTAIFFGIVGLYLINSQSARIWLRLPKRNKRIRDFPWWLFIFLASIIIPALLIFVEGTSKPMGVRPNVSHYPVEDQTSLRSTFQQAPNGSIPQSPSKPTAHNSGHVGASMPTAPSRSTVQPSANDSMPQAPLKPMTQNPVFQIKEGEHAGTSTSAAPPRQQPTVRQESQTHLPNKQPTESVQAVSQTSVQTEVVNGVIWTFRIWL